MEGKNRSEQSSPEKILSAMVGIRQVSHCQVYSVLHYLNKFSLCCIFAHIG